jgi:hypothetical protein
MLRKTKQQMTEENLCNVNLYESFTNNRQDATVY